MKAQDVCLHGHNTATLGRDSSGHCRECKRLRAKAVRASRVKTPRVLLSAAEVRERKRQRDLRRNRAKSATVIVDGLEAEYGACPPMVPVNEWLDAVAVDRAVSGVRPVGRRLTPLETKEVARIRAEKDSLDKHLTWAGIKG